MFEGFEEQDDNNSGQGLLAQNAANLTNKAGSSKSISKLYINGVRLIIVCDYFIILCMLFV